MAKPARETELQVLETMWPMYDGEIGGSNRRRPLTARRNVELEEVVCERRGSRARVMRCHIKDDMASSADIHSV